MAYQWSGKGPDNKGEYVPMWDWLKNDSEIITFCHFILSCRGTRGPRGTRDGTDFRSFLRFEEVKWLNGFYINLKCDRPESCPGDATETGKICLKQETETGLKQKRQKTCFCLSIRNRKFKNLFFCLNLFGSYTGVDCYWGVLFQ